MAKDKGSGPVLNVSVDGTGAEAGANKTDKAFKKINRGAKSVDKALGKTGKRVKDTQGKFRQMASSIAVVDGPLGGVASRFSAFATLLGRVNPKMIGFAVASIAIGAALKKTVGVLIPYEQTMLRLESTLAATGRQSEITSEQLDDFAKNLGADTLTSRQAVIDAAATLATFGEIGSSSFERVLTSAQDLSATFGGDLRSNTQLLARALQSPGEAFSVLERKVGKFTKREKDLLKVLTETGELATAQEIIFAKLAATQGSAVAEASKLGGALDTLGEDIANLSVDFAESINLSEALTATTKALSSVIKAAPPAVNSFSDSIMRLGIVMRPVDTLMQQLSRNILEVGDSIAEKIKPKQVSLLGKSVLSLAHQFGILGAEQTHTLASLFRIDKKTGEFKNTADATAETLNMSLIPALSDATKAEKEQASATENANKFLKEQDERLDGLIAKAERLKLSEDFAKDLEGISQEKSFELKAFGLDGADLELLTLQTSIQNNQQAFDDLGIAGKTALESIQKDIITLGDLQKSQDLMSPIDDYVKNSELGLKKVNELIVSSGEIALDALTRPYVEGETAAQRWKGVMASVLRDVAKEIIRTQIIARAVGFLGGIAGGFGGGAQANRGIGGTPLPVARPSKMGNAFSNGKIIPHAKGGIVDQMSAFPMSGGNVGTIAEGNKPEAIMPLKRTSSGELGVVSSGGGGGSTVINNNISVSVDNSGSNNTPQDSESLGRKVARQIEIKIQQEMSKFVIRERKSGGSLSSGGALA